MKKKILSKEYVCEIGHIYDDNTMEWGGEHYSQFCNFADNEIGIPVSGIIYELYPNGNLKSYETYIDGIKNGDYAYFFENGNMKSFGTMLQGVRHGTLTTWYHNGNIETVAIYKYSFEESFKKWDADGNIVKQIDKPTAFAKEMIGKYENEAMRDSV